MRRPLRWTLAALTRAAFEAYARVTYPRGQKWPGGIIANERRAWREAIATVLLMLEQDQAAAEQVVAAARRYARYLRKQIAKGHFSPTVAGSEEAELLDAIDALDGRRKR